jgi:hypothetical protein
MTAMLRVAISLLLLVAACGDDAVGGNSNVVTTTTLVTSTSGAATTVPTGPTTTLPAFEGDGAEYPPPDFDGLAAFFDPLVAPLGYRVGRGVLIERATYRETPEGDHLALYLEPFGPRTPDDYALEFLPIATLFVPAVFMAWPGLASFDICQEQFDWVGDTPPPGITVFDITREAAAAIDWSTVDLAALLAADESLDGLRIHAVESVQTSAVWSAALDG